MTAQQFWQSYLLAYIFWLEIALGSLGWLMVHHLVGGRWSARIRRVLEQGAMTIIWLALLFIPLLIGASSLYPWANPEHVQSSELLQQKTVWLNLPFFIGRSIFYFAVWIGLAFLFNRWSQEQDHTDDPQLAVKMRRLSAVGILLFMLTATFAAFDWLMSLEPEWFSSIYGLLFIAGGGLAALSLVIIRVGRLVGTQELQPSWVQSINDLGNFLLALVMMWAYFSFSQFLIIWSADIPEETIWYVHRIEGGWLTVGMVLIATHFVLPFLLLLSRAFKRRIRWLVILATLVFVARWLDLYYLIVPAFHPEGVYVHWLDLVLWLMIGGIWLTAYTRQQKDSSPFAQHDPHFGESHVPNEVLASTK